jgi:hypothetical protein
VASDGTIQNCRFCRPPSQAAIVDNVDIKTQVDETKRSNETIITGGESTNFDFHSIRIKFFNDLKILMDEFFKVCDVIFKKENMKNIKPKRAYVKRNPSRVYVRNKKFIGVPDASEHKK